MKKKISSILLLVFFAALFACNKIETAPVSISVQSVAMNKPTTAILVGKSETLSAVVMPAEAENKAVAWSTSNAAIATVSATGVVTAVKEGTATIAVTTKEGGHQATCVVTVSSIEVPVTGVALNHETTAMAVGAASTLTATVAPVTATNQNVDWSTSDAAIATVSAAGVVTAVKEGTATITATTKDGGHQASCVVAVAFNVLGFLHQDPANDIAAAGAVVTITSPNASPGFVWTAALSNPTGFALGTVSGSGAASSVLVTVGVNPTNVPRSSTLMAKGNDGTTSPIELKQAASSLSYVSPSATTIADHTATSVTFTVTGTAGLTLSFAKTSGDEAFSTPADHTCNGSEQTVAVAMAANTGGERQATYTATVTNAGASGLDLTDITIKQEGDIYVHIKGLHWAKGNLVSTGNNSCAIGAPTDYGVYFQFGSLVGWNGGETGNGVGQGEPTTLDKVVWPKEMGATKPNFGWQSADDNDKATLSHFYFNYSKAPWGTMGQNIREFDVLNVGETGTGTFITGRYANLGVGDPCTYYLGGTWRLPTGAEYLDLFGNAANGAPWGGVPTEWSWKVTSPQGAKGPNGLFIPASGELNYSNGSFSNTPAGGRGWSSSVGNSTGGLYLDFTSTVVSAYDSNTRSYGCPVRCVRSAS